MTDSDTLSRRREALRRQGRLHAGHWLIVGLSIAITLFAWHTSRSLLEERSQRRFLDEGSRVVELMRERLQHYEDALLSAVAAIQVQGGEMSWAEWRLYTEHLDLAERYPGVNGIGVIEHVGAEELDAHVARQRAERPDGRFSVHPDHEFDFHLPITYIEPESENAEAIGLDIVFETNRRTAALQARHLGETRISGPIVLVQDAGRTPGFLFFAPYYDGPVAALPAHDADMRARNERRFLGHVYVPLVVRSLVAGVLDQDNRQVSFSIRDGDAVLYDEPGAVGDAVRAATFAHTETAAVYGRTWTFDIYSTAAFTDASGTDQPLLVLVCGLTIDAMLLALFVLMSRSNRRTLDLAEHLTTELVEQADALGEKNRDLECFAQVVSHDLKAPILGIRTVTDFLEEDLSDYLGSAEADPGVSRNLERLHEQASRADTLVRGILDYSVAARGCETRTQVDTGELVANIAESLCLRPGQLETEGELPVLVTQETRLGQVLANLIGNAFKYNPDPENARVRVAVERADGFYRFSVSDNGPGIDPAFHERVFEPFRTLGASPDVDSSGIGLSIVRKAVERHGGTVHVESEPGEGCTFRFTWPAGDGDLVLDRAA